MYPLSSFNKYPFRDNFVSSITSFMKFLCTLLQKLPKYLKMQIPLQILYNHYVISFKLFGCNYSYLFRVQFR